MQGRVEVGAIVVAFRGAVSPLFTANEEPSFLGRAEALRAMLNG